MKIIYVNSAKHGVKECLVDDEDYEVLIKYKWILQGKSGAIKYAVSYNKCNQIKMHRLIMGCTNGDGKIVDHKDRDGLNNQKNNLRICTTSQNQMNKKPSGYSKYLGVSLHRTTRKHYRKKTKDTKVYESYSWWAKIVINKKQISLGHFKNEIDAAKAYDEAAKKYHGEFANPNFKTFHYMD